MIDPQSFDLSQLPWLPFKFICTNKGVRELPRIPSVYFCLLNNGLPVYIGQTSDLFYRWTYHDKKVLIRKLGTERLAWLEFFHDLTSDEYHQKYERIEVEKLFIHYYLPPLNDQMLAGAKYNKDERRFELAKLRFERFKDRFIMNQLELFKETFTCPKGMTWEIVEKYENIVFARCIKGNFRGLNYEGQMLSFQIEDIKFN